MSAKAQRRGLFSCEAMALKHSLHFLFLLPIAYVKLYIAGVGTTLPFQVEWIEG